MERYLSCWIGGGGWRMSLVASSYSYRAAGAAGDGHDVAVVTAVVLMILVNPFSRQFNRSNCGFR